MLGTYLLDSLDEKATGEKSEQAISYSQDCPQIPDVVRVGLQRCSAARTKEIRPLSVRNNSDKMTQLQFNLRSCKVWQA